MSVISHRRVADNGRTSCNDRSTAAAKVFDSAPDETNEGQGAVLHPAWRRLFQLCRKLEHGDIEHLTIQNGLPVSAQVVRQKFKFDK